MRFSRLHPSLTLPVSALLLASLCSPIFASDVVKLTGAGAHSWSTYVGGSGADQGKGISVDAAGRVYVAGQTDSGGWTSGGFDTIHDGGWDVFIACLTDAGAHVWSSHLGGPADEDADEIVAVQGSVYVAGDTRSGNWVAGGFDTSYGGSSDGFVAKITEGEACRVMHDWNGDGIVSIVGDVPPFVDCVYLGDCSDWPEGWLLPIGDCSQDGILSIIGDVPCFVDCVYFGNCSQ